MYMLINTYIHHSVFFRLYWYPTKAIYSAMYVSMKVYPNGPFYMLFVPMLCGLYAMHVRYQCCKYGCMSLIPKYR